MDFSLCELAEWLLNHWTQQQLLASWAWSWIEWLDSRGACRSQTSLSVSSAAVCFSSPHPPAPSRKGWLMPSLFYPRCLWWQQSFGPYDSQYHRMADCHTHICLIITLNRADICVGVTDVFCWCWRVCGVPAGTALLAAQSVLDTPHCSSSIHLNYAGAQRWRAAFFLGRVWRWRVITSYDFSAFFDFSTDDLIWLTTFVHTLIFTHSLKKPCTFLALELVSHHFSSPCQPYLKIMTTIPV